MDLKTKLKSLDEVKDVTVKVSELYVEKNGAFFLKGIETDGYGLDNVGGMRKTLEDLKAEKKEVKTELETERGKFTASQLKVSDLEAGTDGKSKEQLSALRAELTESFKKELDAKDGTIGDLTAENRSIKIDGEVSKALLGVKLNKTGVEALPLLLAGRYGLSDEGSAIVLNDKGGAKIGEGGKDMTILDDIKNSVLPAYPHLVSNTTGGTGGKENGDGPGDVSGKQIDRQEYEALAPQAQIDFTGGGGKVVD